MSETQESLSSILDSTFDKGVTPAPPAEESKVETPAVETPKTEEPPKVERARDETGKFAPKVEAPKVETPKVEEAPLPRADVAAIIDERRKRQALERELQQLRTGQPKPDFWEDPNKAVSSTVQELVEPLRGELLNLQVENARLRHPDFDACMMAFLEASQKDEVLRFQADNSPQPLAFIYREGKRIKELGQYDGDLDKRDAAKFGELKGEISKRDQEIAALKAQLEGKAKTEAELAAVPRSLNQVQSGAAPKVSEEDAESLDKIARFK